MVLHSPHSNCPLHSSPRAWLRRNHGAWDSSAGLEDRPRGFRISAAARADCARPGHSGIEVESQKRRRGGKSAGADLWSLDDSIRASAIFRSFRDLSAGGGPHAYRYTRGAAYRVNRGPCRLDYSRGGRHNSGNRDGPKVDSLELGFTLPVDGNRLLLLDGSQM